MQLNQYTIQKSVSVSGVGLHTGVVSTLTFLPAPPFSGIKFQRIDLEGQPIVEADVDNVVDLSRGTTIEKNGARVNTVEHTLAALVGLGIDNVLIQIDGPEPPILDGSSAKFIVILKDAGLEEQNAKREYFTLTEPIAYSEPERGVNLYAYPSQQFQATVMVDYNSPVLGTQYASLTNISQFEKDFSACRTFVFLHELEMLRKHNLIKGGSLDNAVVIVNKAVDDETAQNLAQIFEVPVRKIQQEGILNDSPLRYPNEPARHKLLDVIGDLALVGRHIKAHIVAERPGHAANIGLAKKIKKAIQKAEQNKSLDYDASQPPILDTNQIAQLLPHRYPFLLVDKIIYLDDKTVTGVKNVTMNEPFFVGHFPENPVMPGVLQIEAMAQTGGILVLSNVDNPKNYWTYFLGIESCRFRKMVLPGDTLVLRAELVEPIRRGIAKMKGEAYVGGKLVCEAIMLASLVKKENV